MRLSTILTLCSLSITISALAIDGSLDLERRGSAEHVLLCNCQYQGKPWSSVAYYSGSPSGAPAASVVASDDSHGTLWWEGAQQSVTFSDGNVFSWYIPGQVTVGTYAGTAKANQGSFYCYNEYNEFQYTTSAGSVCTVVYDCNHNNPPTNVVGDMTTIYYSLSSEYVTFPSAFTTSPWDIFNHAFEKFDGTSGKTVDESSIDLGNGVSINFEGQGSMAGKTLTGLATVLRQVVSAQSGLTKSWTQQEQTTCKVNCEHGVCCEWNYKTVNYWMMAQSVKVYAENSATSSNQGELKYTITYTPPAQDCTLLNVLASALGIASLVPDVGAIFGALGSGVGIVSQKDGC
ncbi:hypothetical protein BGZ60DRAFT_430580 [Tricladium varicosporioides]|nr:hypothetical protein BGZ60DRAFT_430580 [Hymenoscyphus varicosporioides]